MCFVFNTLLRVSVYLAELVSLKHYCWSCFSNTAGGQRALHLQTGICVCMHIFFSLRATALKKVSFQTSKRRRFCLYYVNLMLGIQGQDLKLCCCSLLVGKNCRLNGVSDLVQPPYSSFWPSAALLTKICNNQTSSVSSLHPCVHMYTSMYLFAHAFSCSLLIWQL